MMTDKIHFNKWYSDNGYSKHDSTTTDTMHNGTTQNGAKDKGILILAHATVIGSSTTRKHYPMSTRSDNVSKKPAYNAVYM